MKSAYQIRREINYERKDGGPQEFIAVQRNDPKRGEIGADYYTDGKRVVDITVWEDGNGLDDDEAYGAALIYAAAHITEDQIGEKDGVHSQGDSKEAKGKSTSD